jgi:hypothetical protein
MDDVPCAAQRFSKRLQGLPKVRLSPIADLPHPWNVGDLIVERRALVSVRKRMTLGLAFLAGLPAILILYPQPLFAYSVDYGAFTVHSDRPLDPAMARVIEDAERRLRSSELYRADEKYRVFLCNEPWRLWLLARDTSVGGTAEILFTGNIYIREADAASNRVLIGDAILADAQARPLSYFIAHEAAHVLQSRRFGRLVALRYPRWLIEGHADLVAKAGDFDVGGNRALLNRGDEMLAEHYARTGLYRRYHLMVHAVLEGSGLDAAGLFAAPPSEQAALEAARGR